ncbi:hypothetical protein LCGC14_1741620 [marine sediment metagenome]|uniref:Uncharacterized protein n=1 Tax=marine sediment metagenome TaxID=412755 RepID=A0A0F9H6H3_9ZZZZ|nr:hypothetical protein [bacterium]
MQKPAQITSFLSILIFILLFAITIDTSAQCPMCKGIAESSLKEGSGAAKGLNTGILYLFFTPFILIGVVGYKVYKAHQK